MKYIKYLVTFFIAFSVIGIGVSVQVLAGPSGEENGNGAPIGVPGCNGCTITWSESYPYGLRITMVDGSGNRISGTKTFDIMSTNSGSFMSNKSKGSRYEVAGAGKLSATDGLYSAETGYSIPNYFYSGDPHGVVHDFIVNNWLGSLDNVDTNRFNQLLGKMNSNYDDFMKLCQTEVYFAVEPVTSFKRSDGKYLTGTVSELANFTYYGDPNSGFGVAKSNMLYAFTGKNGGSGISTTLYSEYDLANSQAVTPGTDMSRLEKMVQKSGDGVLGYGLYIYKITEEIPGCKGVPPQKPPTNNGCTYQIKKSTGTCALTQTLKDIGDTDSEWNCIYNSRTSGNRWAAARYYFGLENNYCAVYCREVINTSYPGKGMTVLAGTHFVLGESSVSNGPSNFSLPRLSPITSQSEVECRAAKSSSSKYVEGIDYTRFRNEYADANARVNQTWNSWQDAIAVRMAAEAATENSMSGECYETKIVGHDPISDEEVTVSIKCGEYTTYNYSGTARNGVYLGRDSWSYTDGSGCCGSGGTTKPEEIASRKAIEASAKGDYEKAYQDRETILKNIQVCNYYVYKGSNFNPTINFEYDYIDQNQTFKLKSSKTTNVKTEYYNSGGSASGTYTANNVQMSNYENSPNGYFVLLDKNSGVNAQIDKFKCGTQGQLCDKIVQIYPNNQKVHQFTTQVVKYETPDGRFQYVSKVNGQSYDSQSEAGINYIKIPYSNVPVHYSTPSGNYPYKINITSFGTGHGFNTDPFTGKNLVTFKYNCEFKVKNDVLKECEDLVCDGQSKTTPKDIRVIFRPISLDNPFPSVDADTREPGENWNHIDWNTQKTYPELYIENNRGVTTEEVYSKRSPLYKITLTPALIKQIREYNKKTSYDDFNMQCEKESGKYCKSNFIRQTVLGYNFHRYFTGCGIKGKTSGLKCNTNEAW